MMSAGTPLNWRRGVMEPHLDDRVSYRTQRKQKNRDSHAALDHLAHVQGSLSRDRPTALQADLEDGTHDTVETKR